MESSWNPALRPDSIAPTSRPQHRPSEECEKGGSEALESHSPSFSGPEKDDSTSVNLPGKAQDIDVAFDTLARRASAEGNNVKPRLVATTSFPTVPPLREAPPQDIPSLPKSQAEAIVEEQNSLDSERDLDAEDSIPTQNGDGWVQFASEDQENDDVGFFSQNRDVEGITEASFTQEALARFEEGVPLVANNDEERVSIQPDALNHDASSAFFGTGFDESSKEVDDAARRGTPPMGRKSTSQVLETLQYDAQKANDDGGASHGSFDSPSEKETVGDLIVSKAEDSQPFKDSEGPNGDAQETDISSLWKAALGDDEFLDQPEQISDPPFFFEDDGEGFLEDISEAQLSADQTSNGASNASQLGVGLGQRVVTSNSYVPIAGGAAPSTNIPQARPHLLNQALNPASTSKDSVYGQGSNLRSSDLPTPARPQLKESAQSFVDKSKGGYQSPYDLPMDITRPKKRANVPSKAPGQSESVNIRQAPPPRRSSILSPQIPNRDTNSMHESGTTLDRHPPPLSKPPSSAGGFFEDLPSSKPRPSSSRSAKNAPTVNQQLAAPLPPPSRPITQDGSRGIISGTNASNEQEYTMLPPEKLGLFDEPSSKQSHPKQVPVMSSRYSPAPLKTTSVPPPSNRYTVSPMTAPRPPSSHALQHQPRTSSPLTYRALSSNQPAMQNSYGTENMGRKDMVNNVELPMFGQSESDVGIARGDTSNVVPNRQSGSENRSKESFSKTTPSDYTTLAPSRGSTPPNSLRYSYAPAPHQTPAGPEARRPLSEHPVARQAFITDTVGTSSPVVDQSSRFPGPPIHPNLDQQPNYNKDTGPLINSSVVKAPKGPSYEYIQPTDGRELDALERWKGCPIFAFGFGGKSVKMFPQHIPRFAAGQKIPIMKCSPGEVKIENERTFKLDDSIATFPGPFKNKSKKKETLEWINNMLLRMGSHYNPNEENGFRSTLIGMSRRHDEKLLLWRIVRLLVENDGVLEGNDNIEKAVRAVLSPDLGEVGAAPVTSRKRATSSSMALDPPIHTHMNEIRKHLLRGEREPAVWYAVDRGMWAHAMLISSTMSGTIAKQVAQEFVRKEVNGYRDNTESIAALYQIFAGNCEESVDELVPPSARAGMQMVSKNTDSGPTKNAMDGLDHWRETLTMILSNRTSEDTTAIVALGQLLASYGRVEAAHICYVFARTPSLFGGPDETTASIILLGSDHLRQPFDYGRNLESVLLTEVHDYARSLLPSSSSASTLSPHLQSYRLHHASILAEHGKKGEAQQYCDAILSTLKSTTKPSPYYHGLLLGSLEALQDRLRQAPRDTSGSWISKPSIDKVSGSIWAKFNSYVAGDEDDTSSNSGKATDAAAGPFASVAGESTTDVRAQSSTDLYGDAYQQSTYTGVQPLSNSNYAPTGSYTPRPSLERQTQPNTGFDRSSGSDIYRNDVSLRQDIPRPASSAGMSSRSYAPPPRSSTYASRSREYYPKTFTQAEPEPMLSSPNKNRKQVSVTPPLGRNSQLELLADVTHDSLDREPSQNFTPLLNEGEQQNASADQYHSMQPSALAENQSSSSRRLPDQQPSSYTIQAPPYRANIRDHDSSVDASPTPDQAPSPYEPPVYEVASHQEEKDTSLERPRKSMMDLDEEDDFETRAATLRREEKARKDREADEAFKKAAEADAQRDKIPKLNSKKSWFGGGWFGSNKEKIPEAGTPNAPIKVKLGEESSFYFDKELGKWVNKKGGSNDVPAAPTPPPPKGPPSRTVSAAAGPPLRSTLTPPVPPLPSGLMNSGPSNRAVSGPAFPASPLSSRPSHTSSPAGEQEQAHEEMNTGSGPPSAPPSRPATGQGGSNNIDDLIGIPQARKGGTVKKGKKGRGYVDVMAK